MFNSSHGFSEDLIIYQQSSSPNGLFDIAVYDLLLRLRKTNRHRL